ncbi:MAG: beta-N-acetylhexosaminidase [Chloroflexi bacterium]|nr:beta-N-acetylhexosaminidase [Chloroflexota bacterium]
MLRLTEKIGQMLMVGFDGTVAPPYLLDWLASGRIGGVYLFARNVESPAQVKQLVDSCHNAARHPILVGIDQEGGAVARLRAGFSESPGAMALGASRDTQLAEDIAFMMGRELAALGINWNFAPVADVAHRSANPSVGTRSAGLDKDLVRDFVIAQIKGFERAGVASTAKHFPGLGNTEIDTHEALAKVSGSLGYLYEEDLIPFRGAISADVPCIMTSHVMFEELDDRYPASLSPRVINGLLRSELGYDGAVCTDCMEMKAITDGWGTGESAVLAALAGADMLLFSHSRAGQEAAYDTLLGAAESRRISTERIDKSIARIGALKRRYQLNDRPPLEIVACDAHLSLASKAARAGTVLLRPPDRWPIARGRSRLLCIEFARQLFSSEEDQDSGTALSRYLSQRLAHAESLIVRSEAELDLILAQAGSLDAASEILIIATRNAHMLPWQAQAAQAAIDRHPGATLLCLRDPYDAKVISDAGAILCSNGDSPPSLEAAVDAICGDYVPGGMLTVNLEPAL